MKPLLCSNCGKEIVGHGVLSPTTEERYRQLCPRCGAKRFGQLLKESGVTFQ